MIKLIFKAILILTLCTTGFLAKAQIGYDYAQYDLGAAVGINSAVSADVQTLRYTPSVHFNFNYNQSPYVNYIFELQVGNLKGGDSTRSSSGREFENNFTSFLFRVQLQAGELIDYSSSPLANAFKNAYVSAGIGYIVNHIVAKSADVRVPEGYTLAGDNNAQVPFIPFRVGYEFKIYNQYSQPSVKIDFGYQYNLVLSDNLDGYATGTTRHDAFAQFTVGVKFALGGVTSYRKQIHY